MLKKYLLTGLLIWLPIGMTLWVVNLIFQTMDQTLNLLPHAWQPDVLLGVHIPGLGVILTLLTVFLTGVLAANMLGQQLVQAWELLLSRIPVVRAIYGSIKQVSDTLFSGSGHAFSKVVLIQYPRPGVWTIAFLTGVPSGEVANHLPQDAISVYVPTTPNPTSGFMLLISRADIVELNMSVDSALKYIISMGVVEPAHVMASLLSSSPPSSTKNS